MTTLIADIIFKSTHVLRIGILLKPGPYGQIEAFLYDSDQDINHQILYSALETDPLLDTLYIYFFIKIIVVRCKKYIHIKPFFYE
jgi:hypothetical protein